MRVGNGEAEHRGAAGSRVGDAQPVDCRDHDAAERRKRLCVAKHFFAAHRVWEELRQPCDRRDELDAHADERRSSAASAAFRSTLRSPTRTPTRRKSGCCTSARAGGRADRSGSRRAGRRCRPQTPGHKTAGQPTSGTAATWRRACQFEQRRPDDERQHEDFIDIERETDGGDRADHPLDRRQPHPGPVVCCHVRRIIT